MRLRERILAAVGILAAAVFLLGLAFDSPGLRLIAKPIPVLCLATWVASDTLIGLDRFHAPLESARVPIILLYWLGQLGIAAGAVFSPIPRGTGIREKRGQPATISGNLEP